MVIDISTGTDHDNAISQKAVHHEQPTGTDWATSDTVQKGYSSVMDEIGVSLLAYYPLGESSGSTANDVSGNGTDGTYAGTETLANVSGPFGYNAPSLGGGNHSCNTRYTTADDATAICAWFKHDGFQQNYEAISNCWGPNSQPFGCFRNQDGETLRFVRRQDNTGSFENIDLSTKVDDGNWHWVIVQQDPNNRTSDTNRSIIELDRTVDSNGDDVIAPTDASTDHHGIGSSPDGDTHQWHGELAHLMFWDGPLTQNERDIIYNAPF